MSPISKFQIWYEEELQSSVARVPSACCLSTIGEDGYPNARFVALKDILDDSFVVTGPVQSRKGREIGVSPKVALTFWWEQTQKQVRIQGDAFRLADDAADRYFTERDREACIVSRASRQGEVLESLSLLHQTCKDVAAQFHNKAIPRPADWGGFHIVPLRVEFLAFSQNRFHERELYEKNDSAWKVHLLQP